MANMYALVAPRKIKTKKKAVSRSVAGQEIDERKVRAAQDTPLPNEKLPATAGNERRE